MILAQLGKTGDYGRRLSEIIYDLVVKYKMPIGGSSQKETKGYFIIENKRDLYIAKRDIQSRTTSMKLRYEALGKIKF